MKDFFDKLWGDYITSAIITVIAGLLITVFHGVAMDIVCIALGLCATLFGIVLISRYVSKPLPINRFELLLGLILGASGIYIICVPTMLQNIVAIAFGIVIIYHSIVDFQSTFAIKRNGDGTWILAFIFSLIVLAAGFALVLMQNKAVKSLMLVLGIMLTVEGALNIWFAVKVKKLHD